MAKKEIIPFGVNLNKLPPREDSCHHPYRGAFASCCHSSEASSYNAIEKKLRASLLCSSSSVDASSTARSSTLKDAPKGPKIVILSWNRPNYKSTSTKTITKVIKLSYLNPYNFDSPTKSQGISNQPTYKPRS
jgi:hypothetical protein